MIKEVKQACEKLNSRLGISRCSASNVSRKS